MNNNGHTARSDWVQTVLAQYEGSLTRYAAHLTGDADRARDVVQDTFVRLWREEPGRVEGRVAEWLFTVCRNRALDVQWKQSRLRPLGESEMDGVASGEPSPAAAAEERETASWVLDLLRTLPPKHEEVIRLKFQGGLSYREIGAVTGLTVTNVGFLIHTGIKKIRERVRAETKPAYEN